MPLYQPSTSFEGVVQCPNFWHSVSNLGGPRDWRKLRAFGSLMYCQSRARIFLREGAFSDTKLSIYFGVFVAFLQHPRAE